ncbi:hypothetical protein JOD31_001508 [Methylopila capsulata]|uniref:Uncharacterized protein n=1 Tax=Methylopila capsulata TaxID=61654 RepID=A0A9W6MQU5_9HYPH|nr:hypothetical protein [Methylopila capsulata]MBM7851283.1 hypothetical protein [Methylopila capsulata]GLK54341.1 hypothetical protein GCM10008170_03600 [Methylopila capsulata]
MATEIEKILVSNPIAVKYRSKKVFKTQDTPGDERNLMPEHKLIMGRLDSSVPIFDYLPIYQGDWRPIEVDFVDWWNRDVIYRASAAKAGAPPGAIPLEPEDQVPYKRRQKFVRRDIVSMMRNKFGAHLDDSVPENLDELQKTSSFGINVSQVLDDGTELNSWDGSLNIGAGPCAAMMRQIAFEVLAAYK